MKVSSLQVTPQDILEISRLLSFILDQKDPYTADHSKVVRTVSVYLGSKLAVSGQMLFNLGIGGYLHDIGKISVPDSILFKPGRLTAEEFEVMKNHTSFGAQFIDKFFILKRFEGLVRYHHEKYSGGGYPAGIEGEEIPLEARIISIADVYHALYSKRCYKPAFTEREIRDEFKRCRGQQFDPYLTDEFLLLLEKKEIDALLQEEPIQAAFEADWYGRILEADWGAGLPAEHQLRQLIELLTTALDTMNPPYAEHCKNVTAAVAALVKEMELDTQNRQEIVLAALLHDIGRMGQRPGQAYADRHALIGEKMLANITRFAPLLPMVRGHHERFDGTGGPDGLRGRDIPLGARIIAVADNFDALSKRPADGRGHPLTKKEAMEQLKTMAGSVLDPELVAAFAGCPCLLSEG